MYSQRLCPESNKLSSPTLAYTYYFYKNKLSLVLANPPAGVSLIFMSGKMI